MPRGSGTIVFPNALVNSLDVHIEHGGGVNVEPPLFLQVDNQRLLLLELDIEPFGLKHEAWAGGGAQYIRSHTLHPSPAARRHRSWPPAASATACRTATAGRRAPNALSRV